MFCKVYYNCDVYCVCFFLVEITGFNVINLIFYLFITRYYFSQQSAKTVVCKNQYSKVRIIHILSELPVNGHTCIILDCKI